MDQVTAQRIALLHPAVRPEVIQIVNQANQQLTGRAQVRISQGLRTIQEQDGLYAQGRTKPGKIVTNAKGGSSYHNYGLAVDIVLITDGKEASWDTENDFDKDGKSDWMEVVSIFKQYGYEWGGEWTSIKDYPHFQKTFNNSVSQLYAKYKNKTFIPNTTYVTLQ